MYSKYNPFDWFRTRFGGKGIELANVLAENNFLLASGRKMRIAEKPGSGRAWNTGLNSFVYPGLPEGTYIEWEWYYTDFNKQVVVDVDAIPTK